MLEIKADLIALYLVSCFTDATVKRLNISCVIRFKTNLGSFASPASGFSVAPFASARGQHSTARLCLAPVAGVLLYACVLLRARTGLYRTASPYLCCPID